MIHYRRTVLALVSLVVAIAAGIGGFTVARGLATVDDPPEVSVLELPSTATPAPVPTATGSPSASVNSRIRVRTSNGDVDVDGQGRTCPAGCSCDQHPNGIVIRCTGN